MNRQICSNDKQILTCFSASLNLQLLSVTPFFLSYTVFVNKFLGPGLTYLFLRFCWFYKSEFTSIHNNSHCTFCEAKSFLGRFLVPCWWNNFISMVPKYTNVEWLKTLTTECVEQIWLTRLDWSCIKNISIVKRVYGHAVYQ